MGNLYTRVGSASGARCGNITINGETVTANGGSSDLDNGEHGGAGIGSGHAGTCGNITVNGGTVTATGGKIAPGIGSGSGVNIKKAKCGDITISGTVTQITATKGENADYSIGAGVGGTCGTVSIGGEVTGNIAESPYTYQP